MSIYWGTVLAARAAYFIPYPGTREKYLPGAEALGIVVGVQHPALCYFNRIAGKASTGRLGARVRFEYPNTGCRPDSQGSALADLLHDDPQGQKLVESLNRRLYQDEGVHFDPMEMLRWTKKKREKQPQPATAEIAPPLFLPQLLGETSSLVR